MCSNEEMHNAWDNVLLLLNSVKNDCFVILKFSFHSSSVKCCRTTLSYQFLIRTLIHRRLDLWGGVRFCICMYKTNICSFVYENVYENMFCSITKKMAENYSLNEHLILHNIHFKIYIFLLIPLVLSSRCQ